MCIIIDADYCSNFKQDIKFPEDELILDFIEKGKLNVYSGKELTKQLNGGGLRDLIMEWESIGKFIEASDQQETEIKKYQERLKRDRNLIPIVSNDDHILATAQILNVAVLCSYDEDLRTDFQNLDIINNPRGKLYNSKKEKRLELDVGSKKFNIRYKPLLKCK